MEKKVFEVTIFYVLSQLRYLLLIAIFASIGSSILYLTYAIGLEELRGFAYPTKQLDELLQISSSTYPLEASINYKLIIRKDIYNYTLFLTIICHKVKNLIAKITYLSVVFLHLASVFLSSFMLTHIISSEIAYVLRNYCINKYSYAITLGAVSIVLTIPLPISLLLSILVLCNWIKGINYMELSILFIIASSFPSVISVILLLLTKINEVAYIYGFLPPLMALIDSNRAYYYIPILYILTQNNWLYALIPYIIITFLLLLLYSLKGGIR